MCGGAFQEGGGVETHAVRGRSTFPTCRSRVPVKVLIVLRVCCDRAAHEYLEQGHVRGKVVLLV